jgi:hypothetical protein
MIIKKRCRFHVEEFREWIRQDRETWPDSSDGERFGRRILYLAAQPVEEPCEDCKVVSYIEM